MPIVTVRFAIGDRVRIVRAGPLAGRIGTIVEVDPRPLIPHYTVSLGHFHERRLPQFDLAAAVKDRKETDDGHGQEE